MLRGGGERWRSAVVGLEVVKRCVGEVEEVCVREVEVCERWRCVRRWRRRGVCGRGGGV